MRTHLLCLALAACTQADATPNGSPGPARPAAGTTTDVRNVGAFHGLDVSAVLDIDLAIGATTRVELTGDAAVLPRVETKVDNGVLAISMHGNFDHAPKIHATITTPELTSVSVSGVVNMRATKLAAKALDITLSGVGTLDLSGTTDLLRANLSGSGELHAKDLAAGAATIDLSGAGEASIQATKQVTASISGVGTVAVYGHPATVNKTITGVGHLQLK